MEEKSDRFRSICHQHGLNVTPQRVAIYRELISSREHPSATLIYRRIKKYFPNISLATVSNTLLTFSKIGLARIVGFSGDPKRFDPRLQLHHHFRCIRCGRIIDFHNDVYDKIEVPVVIKKKFVVLEKTVHLQGLCDECRVNGNELERFSGS